MLDLTDFPCTSQRGNHRYESLICVYLRTIEGMQEQAELSEYIPTYLLINVIKITKIIGIRLKCKIDNIIKYFKNYHFEDENF